VSIASTVTLRRLPLRILIAACLLAVAVRTRAQSPQSAKYGDQTLAVGGVFNATHLQYGEHWVLGAVAFVDADLTWHYGIEGEATWTRWHEQSGTHDSTYLIGPRYRFTALDNYRFSPYAKFLIGGGDFDFPSCNGTSTGTGSYFVMAPGAGIDCHRTPRFDIRLCDFEDQIWPQFTFGSISNLSVSAGLRYPVFQLFRKNAPAAHNFQHSRTRENTRPLSRLYCGLQEKERR
jgi:hypothetical protein